MSSRYPEAYLRWLPAIIWMVVIFVLSSMPLDDISDIGWIATLTRKGGHVAVFGTLALLVWWALPDGRARPFIAFLFTALYGVSDEIHQTFVVSRVGSPLDAVIDAAGAAIALGVVTWSQRRLGQRNSGKTSLPKAAMLSRWAATSDSQK